MTKLEDKGLREGTWRRRGEMNKVDNVKREKMKKREEKK